MTTHVPRVPLKRDVQPNGDRGWGGDVAPRIRAHTSTHPEAAPGLSSDPTLSLWRDFAHARACARKLTHRQQAIESVMVERAGFPVIHVPLTGGGHVSVVGLEDIEDLMEEHAAEVQFGEAERASLAAHQALWSAADSELGYSAALRAEGRALDHVR
ncbi:MAG: hypothetical protein KGO02_11200, partial [Alphaproteobacteria bacterium]|nr:hypothetical protein [Alphaproteobacteria bacterium]